MADRFDPRSIPIIGDDIYQVGQVYRIWSQPCAVDPWIAVTAFFTYTPMLLWSLAKPDPMDFLIGRFGRPHSRIRRRRFKLEEAWKKPIPIKPGLQTLLWTGVRIKERVGWYFLVADATTDLAINWTSMVYEFSGCHTGTQPFGWMSGGYKFIGPTAPGGVIAVQGDSFDSKWPGGASLGAVAMNDARPRSIRATVAGGTTFWNNMDGGMIGAYILINKGGGNTEQVPLTYSGSLDDVASYEGATQYYNDWGSGWSYSVRAISGGGLFSIHSVYIEIVGAEPQGIEWDP